MLIPRWIRFDSSRRAVSGVMSAHRARSGTVSSGGYAGPWVAPKQIGVARQPCVLLHAAVGMRPLATGASGMLRLRSPVTCRAPAPWIGEAGKVATPLRVPKTTAIRAGRQATVIIERLIALESRIPTFFRFT